MTRVVRRPASTPLDNRWNRPAGLPKSRGSPRRSERVPYRPDHRLPLGRAFHLRDCQTAGGSTGGRIGYCIGAYRSSAFANFAAS